MVSKTVVPVRSNGDLIDRCEYIFFRGLHRTAYARVSRDTITDTELQIGQFVVPEGGAVVTNHTTEALYPRIPRELLPKEHVRPLLPLVSVSCLPGPSGSLMHTMAKDCADTDITYLTRCALVNGTCPFRCTHDA